MKPSPPIQRETVLNTYPTWLIRVFHWALFLLIVLLYNTEQIPSIHADLGYIAFFLVLGRVIWGIWTRHSSGRLSSYPLGFRKTLQYFKEVFTWKPAEYPTLNPASAWMAVTFFTVIALLTVTGMISLAVNYYEGMWSETFRFIDNPTSLIIKKLHIFLTSVLLALIAIHVSGALLACVQHRRNIIKTMIMGKKEIS